VINQFQNGLGNLGGGRAHFGLESLRAQIRKSHFRGGCGGECTVMDSKSFTMAASPRDGSNWSDKGKISTSLQLQTAGCVRTLRAISRFSSFLISSLQGGEKVKGGERTLRTWGPSSGSADPQTAPRHGTFPRTRHPD